MTLDDRPDGKPPEIVIKLPEVAPSTRPIVGPALDHARRALHRENEPIFTQVIAQINAALAHLKSELAATRDQVAALCPAAEAEARATVQRDLIQRDLAHVANRLDQVEIGIDGLQLAPRLARLERQARAESFTMAAPAESPPPTTTAEVVGSAPDVAFDYFAFEARFRGSEATIRERQQAYVEVLAGSRHVVDLGCGRGELLQLLTEHGIDAYGVDLEPDFVDLVRSKGIRAVQQDIQAHLEGLAVGEVDGIVISHVVEHLKSSQIYALVQRAADVLSKGGTLVVETPNPESLLAGSINFHRDPTHRRPVHPDTLAFLCESAGFGDVAIRRLAMVPASAMLPEPPSAADGTVTAYLATVIEQLNHIIYGYQDYAVIARNA